MKIEKVFGRELFNGSGMPALSCEIVLEDGTFVSATVPSDPLMEQEGFFVAKDGGTRCSGNGLQKAAQSIESLIAPILVEKMPEVFICDALLSELDGTAARETIGANVTLAVSMAVCKAQAAVQEMELFELIAQLQDSASVSLPFPLITLASGGVRLHNGLPFQSIVLVPVGAENFRRAVEHALTVFHIYKEILENDGKTVFVSEAGGLSASYKDVFEPFDYIVKALKIADLESSFVLGIDAAADQWYDVSTSTYRLGREHKKTEYIIDIYKKLYDTYPLYSLENGLSWQDLAGGKKLFDTFGTTLQIASNDGFSHSATLLQGLDAQPVINASVIRLAGASSVTELLESIQFCQNHGLNTIVACGSGETEETFLADLAIGTSAGQIQAGGGFRSEFIAKYNRLLFIEDLLAGELLNLA